MRTFFSTCLQIFSLKYCEFWEILRYEVLIETWACDVFCSKEETQFVLIRDAES